MSLSPHDSVYDAFAAAVASYGDHPFLYLVTDTAARYGVECGAMTYHDAHREVTRLLGGYQALGWPRARASRRPRRAATGTTAGTGAARAGRRGP